MKILRIAGKTRAAAPAAPDAGAAKLETTRVTTAGSPGRTASITYTLKKTSDVALESLSIGYTTIDLGADQDSSDPNTFATKGSKKYSCFKEADGIQITCRANGKAGGSWTLNVQVDGAALGDNPIEEQTDSQGHLDHDKKQL